MRVEVARPQEEEKKKKRDMFEGDGLGLENEKVKKKGKRKVDDKKKNEDGVIPGFELPDGRKVQRGWTESAVRVKGSSKMKTGGEKKKEKPKAKSKYSDGPECLFKTKLPPNVAVLGKSSTVDGKARKRKRGELGRDVVVHEFSNTIKHASFLKESQGGSGKKSASEYIDGKGWVDDGGNAVEPGPPTRRTRSAVGKDSTSHPSDESIEIASSELGNVEKELSIRTTNRQATADQEVDDDETSSSGISYSSENHSESDDSPGLSPQPTGNHNSDKNNIKTPIDDDVTRETQAISLNNTPAPEVHPLEALFKRPKLAASASTSNTPKKPTLELSTSFTFFGESPNNNEEPENPSFLVPQTPFTQQDFRARRQRSAAPTPDTAAPGKTFGDVWGRRRGGESIKDEDDDDDDDDDENEDDIVKTSIEARSSNSPSPNTRAAKLPSVAAAAAAAGKEESGATKETEFEKWFWEHRGENNRAWKRRRREVGREKRREDGKNQNVNQNTRTRG